MAMDMFLEIADIEGESKDNKMKDKIDLLAWSWGLSNAGTFHGGGGGGAGKANVQDFSFTKYLDKASVKLQLACATGKHIPTAKLTIRKAGGSQEVYLSADFTDLLITSYQTGGSGAEDRLTENFSVNFGKVKVEYFKQGEDGIVASAGTATIDPATQEHMA